MRDFSDSTGREESGVAGPPEVTVDVDGAPDDKNGCCGGPSVEVEVLGLFIEERDGGGGKLCGTACCKAEVEALRGP